MMGQQVGHGWLRGAIQELSEAECRDLVLSRSVGRICFATPDGLAVLPVNYAVDQDGITFRTSPYNSIAAHVATSEVAFEVDSFDELAQSGWSVLVRGEASLEAGLDADAPWPTPWPEGTRSVVVRVRGRAWSGRRVGH